MITALSPKIPTTIRLDMDTKKWAQSFARRSGLDLSTLITLSLRETRRKGNIVVDPMPLMTAEKQKYYEDMIRQDDAGTLPLTRYHSIEALKADLLQS